MATPQCHYFGTCGGCTSQHLEYPAQLEWKRSKLAAATGFEDVLIFSAEQYHYRNRMDFIFSIGKVGLRRAGSWKDIVDIKECSISDMRINKLLSEVRESFGDVEAYDSRRRAGTYKYAVIRSPRSATSISFVLNDESTKLGPAIDRIKEFAKRTTADSVIVTYTAQEEDSSISGEYFVVKGSDTLRETLAGREFAFNAQGFFQNNTEVAQLMHEHVSGVLSRHDTKDATLLDLYGGVGCFGIKNAERFKDVLIVEEVESAIIMAQKNIAKNGIRNARAMTLDAKRISRLDMGKPLFVIADPPRSGMHQKTISELVSLRPHLLIYISCNSEQLAKDLPKFAEHNVSSVALFDMFPNTPHIEAVVELRRKDLEMLGK